MLPPPWTQWIPQESSCFSPSSEQFQEVSRKSPARSGFVVGCHQEACSGPGWTCAAAPSSLCPASVGWEEITECKQIRPGPTFLAGSQAGARPGLVATGRAWGGQLIFLVSILGCDNTQHPLGLAGHCMVNLFFWRWEEIRGHPDSEEVQALERKARLAVWGCSLCFGDFRLRVFGLFFFSPKRNDLCVSVARSSEEALQGEDKVCGLTTDRRCPRHTQV